jgi:hypothetical protein
MTPWSFDIIKGDTLDRIGFFRKNLAVPAYGRDSKMRQIAPAPFKITNLGKDVYRNGRNTRF